MAVGWKQTYTEVPEAINDRTAATVRLVVGVIMAAALYPGRGHLGALSVVTYGVILANALYGAVVYLIARRRGAFSKWTATGLTLGDITAYSLFIRGAVGLGITPILPVLYLFPIFVACSRLGALSGIVMASGSSVAYLVAVRGPVHSLLTESTLLPALYLVGLGVTLSCWGAVEARSKRRLGLLHELSLTANPRLGVDRTAGLFVQRVLEFVDADACVLAQFDPESEQFQLRTATRRRLQGGAQSAPAASWPNQILPALPRSGVAVFTDDRGWRRRSSYRIGDPVTRTAKELPANQAGLIARWLEARCFIAVPLRRHEIFRGYLCIGAARSRAFRIDDAFFLQHVADQIMPVLEHIRLVDRLASDAADEERRRVARSIHDRIIQPYLGLQIGLKAMHQMIRSDAPPATVRALDSLITMTRDGVAELRQYVHGLRQSAGGRGILADSITRYASKFETATGVHVVVVDRIGRLDIQDRLAADIFQMAAEALSNVHRHTAATSVTLVLEASESGTVILRVENEVSANTRPRDFMPGSISDRADALGGHTQVELQEGRTVVRVEIPL
jgi:signal transduction histidine kinase